MTLEQEQQIEHLQKQCNVLSNALRTVDHEVDRAARKYLRPEVQTGHLKFKDFMELLVREVRVFVKREIRNDSKVATALTKDMRDIFDAKIEERIEALIPVIKGKLSDYITIRVLLQKRDVPKIPFARFDASEPSYYAMPIRGDVKQGLGVTPEQAYSDLREKLILRMFEIGPKDFAHSMLMLKSLGTVHKFEKAAPFMTDNLEGFSVEVRKFEEESE